MITFFQGSLRFSNCAAAVALALVPLAVPIPAGAADEPAAKAPLPLGGECDYGLYAADTFQAPPAFPGQTNAPIVTNSARYTVEVVYSGLPNPRSMAFISDKQMLVSVWPGTLHILDTDGTLSPALGGVPDVYKGRDGGFAIALDPDFANNRTLYLAYRIVKPGQVVEPGKPPAGLGQVTRARLAADGTRLEDVKLIYQGGYLRRIAVAKDGKLIITSASGGEMSQNLDDPDGKVLRINTDGTIPADNPFVATPGARGEIYDLGHRDMDGLAVDDEGQIWTMEHGPRGGDEINRIEAGKNYGFPIIGYGLSYENEPVNGGKTAQEGMEQPIYYWSRNIAPGGLMIYSGKMFPEWRGDFFTGSLVQRRLVRMHMDDGKVSSLEYLLADRCQRVRDVREAPDGSLFVLTNDMAANKPGQVLRISSPG